MYPTEPNNTNQKIITSLVIIAAVALLSLGIKGYNNNQKSPVIAVSSPSSSPISLATPATSSNTPASTNPAAPSYKDGTYNATAYYYVPHGEESIGVTITVANGIVTNSSVQNSETNPESAQFQLYFTSQYKSQVVGKSLKGLQISYVAGASDTSQGFNAALVRIQSQAQA